jgi:hypothetical protein
MEYIVIYILRLNWNVNVRLNLLVYRFWCEIVISNSIVNYWHYYLFTAFEDFERQFDDSDEEFELLGWIGSSLLQQEFYDEENKSAFMFWSWKW